jgi:DNA-binding NarL/FixJ family response regulator
VDTGRLASVLIVEGNGSLARVLAELLDDEPGFSVAGVALSGEEAVAIARGAPVDVVLVDERLDASLDPGVLRTLRRACPDAVVLLWSYDEVHTAAVDVDGVLPRGMTFRELVRGVRALLRERRGVRRDPAVTIHLPEEATARRPLT